MENRVRECSEEKDGLGGAGRSPEGLWQQRSAVVEEDDKPLCLFDDSAIW